MQLRGCRGDKDFSVVVPVAQSEVNDLIVGFKSWGSCNCGLLLDFKIKVWT